MGNSPVNTQASLKNVWTPTIPSSATVCNSKGSEICRRSSDSDINITPKG